MSTASGSVTERGIELNNMIEDCKSMLKIIKPGLSDERLETIANLVAQQTKRISNSVSSYDELEKIKESLMKYMPPQEIPFLKSVQYELEILKKDRLVKEYLTPNQKFDPDQSTKLDKKISLTSLNAIKKAKNLTKTCQTCNASASNETLLQRCSRCKNTLYCSVECQKKDWDRHKKVECIKK